MGTIEVLEVRSSVTLAALLYYNALYSPLFFIIEMTLITYKLRIFRFRSTMQEDLVQPALIIWFLTELGRFYAGYVGNLNENVPYMSFVLDVSHFEISPLNEYAR